MGWIRLALAVIASLGLGVGEASAQEAAAGRFITVIGDVQVLSKDGSSRRLAARSGDIWPGESIVTGSNSLAQLRMSDGGALSVRSDTQIKLDAYRYSGHKDPKDNFLVSLLRGGFRTITGLIARNYRENYRVQTSAMTIGVRGTDFEVVHVLKPAAGVPPGTYNRVYFGITTMRSRAGATLLVNRNQTAFVPLAGNLPPALVLPPAGIFGKPTPPPPAPDDASQGSGGKGDAGRGDASRGDAGKGDGGKSDSRMGAGGKGEGSTFQPASAVQDKSQAVAPAAASVKSFAAPLLNPIDSPRVLDTAPALQTAPSTTLQIAPTTIAPAVKAIGTAPVTTTVVPAVKSIDATTISPVLTAPTTTISPAVTAPATTTISPVLTAPVTTTVTPILTAPTTTITPVLTAPATTTISPTLTAPTTTTIIKR
jgi:FecR protein